MLKGNACVANMTGKSEIDVRPQNTQSYTNEILHSGNDRLINWVEDKAENEVLF